MQGVCQGTNRRTDTHSALDEAITLWRNGFLVFAVCDKCTGCHDIVIRPTGAGIEVRGASRGPLVIRSTP